MKKMLLLIPVMLLFASCIRGNVMADYHITNVVELQAITPGHLADDCILDNDIDASATVGWNGGLGFVPIGTLIAPFTGSFDGQNYRISDLHINRPGTSYIGLFGVTNGATLSNCYISGQFSAESVMGGLVGRAESVTSFSSCHSSVNLQTPVQNANSLYVGGLIGNNLPNNVVENCSYEGNIDLGDVGGATWDIRMNGGLVGYNEAGASISRCFAKGNMVAGNSGDDIEFLGGLVGFNAGIISDSYARVSITTGNAVDDISRIAGLVGTNTGNISDSYSTGSINPGVAGDVLSHIGGLVGSNTGTVNNSFWDTETSGQATSDGGTGRTTAQMNAKSTFTDAGWDFDTVWSICDPPTPAYPWLQWENVQCLGGAIISLIG